MLAHAHFCLERVTISLKLDTLTDDSRHGDQVWIHETRFERVSRAAIILSNERNAQMQVGVQDAVCTDVPVFDTIDELEWQGPTPAFNAFKARFDSAPSTR